MRAKLDPIDVVHQLNGLVYRRGHQTEVGDSAGWRSSLQARKTSYRLNPEAGRILRKVAKQLLNAPDIAFRDSREIAAALLLHHSG
jgi:enolase